jgi:hypothetical protein
MKLFWARIVSIAVNSASSASALGAALSKKFLLI